MVVCSLAQLEIQRIPIGAGGDSVKGLMVYDPLHHALRVYELKRNPECPACSKLGVVNGQSN